jgi:glutathione S-transferase
MKLYMSAGPNPHVVKMYLLEKGLSIPEEQVDVMKNENRQPAHLARNPHGQMPTLELDDGRYISEILPICEYLEELYPEPVLIGATPEERAETRMWARRVDLNICEPLTNGFRYSQGLALFRDRMITLPEAADGLKRIAQDRLAWLNAQMAGRNYLCGARFTLADIHLFCFLHFGNRVGQPLNAEFANLAAWYGRVKTRPSAPAEGVR